MLSRMELVSPSTSVDERPIVETGGRTAKGQWKSNEANGFGHLSRESDPTQIDGLGSLILWSNLRQRWVQ